MTKTSDELRSTVPMAVLWHITEDETPPVSGTYIVFTQYGYFTQMDYSKKHNAFNVVDNGRVEHAIPNEGIVAWAKTTPIVAELTEAARVARVIREEARLANS